MKFQVTLFSKEQSKKGPCPGEVSRRGCSLVSLRQLCSQDAHGLSYGTDGPGKLEGILTLPQETRKKREKNYPQCILKTEAHRS